MMSEAEQLENAVDLFAMEMKSRLHNKADQGFKGWNESKYKQVIQNDLNDHLRKELTPKNLVDIANYAMFLWNLEQCGEEIK